MNDYKITDLTIGQKEQFKYVITEEKMISFLKLTGDENPLHTDDIYAKAKGYPNCVVYGMLTASLISRLAGVHLPGKYCLLQGVEVKFTKPVFVEDELTVIGEVVKVDINLSYLEVKVTILNQYRQKVLRGLVKAGVLN